MRRDVKPVEQGPWQQQLMIGVGAHGVIIEHGHGQGVGVGKNLAVITGGTLAQVVNRRAPDLLAKAGQFHVGQPLDLIKEGIDAGRGFGVEIPVGPVFFDLGERVRLRVRGVGALGKIMQHQRVALVIHLRLEVQVGERGGLINRVKPLPIRGDVPKQRQIIGALVRILVVHIVIFERGLAPAVQMQVQFRPGANAPFLPIIQMQPAVRRVAQKPRVSAQHIRPIGTAVTGQEIEIIHVFTQGAPVERKVERRHPVQEQHRVPHLHIFSGNNLDAAGANPDGRIADIIGGDINVARVVRLVADVTR